MDRSRRLLFLPDPVVGAVRDVDPIEVPDQLLDEVEVLVVVPEDVVALVPPAECPNRQADGVVLPEAPDLGADLGAVGGEAGMEIVDLALGRTVDDPPVDTRRPAKEDPVEQRVHARPQRVEVAERLERQECVDRVPDPDAPVEVDLHGAVGGNGTVEAVRIAATLDLPQALSDIHPSLVVRLPVFRAKATRAAGPYVPARTALLVRAARDAGRSSR